jgi:hypothetical protein
MTSGFLLNRSSEVHADIRSDDPWNQTAADNAQWLRQFKRDVGILDEPNDPNESNLSGLYSMRNAL